MFRETRYDFGRRRSVNPNAKQKAHSMLDVRLVAVDSGRFCFCARIQASSKPWEFQNLADKNP